MVPLGSLRVSAGAKIDHDPRAAVLRALEMAPRRVALLACLVAACGHNSGSQPPEKHDGAMARDAEQAALEVSGRPLGMPDLEAYEWRKRGGQPAFRTARKAEAREDWPAVVTTCRQALTADPGHLEAAWLLAAALGKLGKLDEVLAPLQLAVAGDFAKWGPASIEHPALQAFLGTPVGEAWRRRVDRDLTDYIAALGRSMIVTAGGDLYAYDPDTTRWYRLTRTSGAVIGTLAIPSAHRIAYVARTRTRAKRELAIGFLDLGRGRTTRAVALGTAGPITVAYGGKPAAGFWIGNGTPRPTSWRVLDDDNRLRALGAKAVRPPGAWLEVHGKTAVLHPLPVPTVSTS